MLLRLWSFCHHVGVLYWYTKMAAPTFLLRTYVYCSIAYNSSTKWSCASTFDLTQMSSFELSTIPLTFCNRNCKWKPRVLLFLFFIEKWKWDRRGYPFLVYLLLKIIKNINNLHQFKIKKNIAPLNNLMFAWNIRKVTSQSIFKNV